MGEGGSCLAVKFILFGLGKFIIYIIKSSIGFRLLKFIIYKYLINPIL